MSEGTNGQEVVVVQNQSLSEMTDDIIASAERRIASLQKIITIALKITNENDWVDQNGKPYLQGSGAEKVARLFGISWKDIKSEKIMTSDENGPFYYYQATGTFSLKGDSIVAVGTCSSKDQFFAVKWEGQGEDRARVLKPLSEVDETNILKSAYTNMVTNGVTRLLGLRNLTWDQVKQAGLDSGKVAKVSYASGGAGGGKISEAQRKRLFAILCQGSTDEKDRATRQEEMRSFLRANYKIEHSRDIERKDYEKVCAQAESIAKTRTAESV